MNFYRILFYLALPFLGIYSLARALQDGGYRYLWQRVGARIPVLD